MCRITCSFVCWFKLVYQSTDFVEESPLVREGTHMIAWKLHGSLLLTAAADITHPQVDVVDATCAPAVIVKSGQPKNRDDGPASGHLNSIWEF